MLGNDDALVRSRPAACRPPGEPMWPLPIPDEMPASSTREIADLKHIGDNPTAAR